MVLLSHFKELTGCSMAYIIPKKKKKESILDNQKTMDFCPLCYSTGNEIKRTPQYIQYQCESCNNKWNVNPAYEEKIKKSPAVLIRDKSASVMVRDKSGTTGSKPADPKIQQIIEDAINKKQLVQFDYTKFDTIENRLVQPYRLEVRKGELSLFCFDLDHDGIRIFKLSSMTNVSSQDPKLGT